MYLEEAYFSSQAKIVAQVDMRCTDNFRINCGDVEVDSQLALANGSTRPLEYAKLIRADANTKTA